MKKITFFTFFACIFLQQCKTKDKLININLILDKTPSEMETILGKVNSTEPIKGYPCEKSDCNRRVFQNGKYDVLFVNNKVRQIIISSIPDYTNEPSAIVEIGLKPISPTIEKRGEKICWNNIKNLYEVCFYQSYVVISVIKPD